MLEKKLEEAYNNRKYLKRQYTFWLIGLVLTSIFVTIAIFAIMTCSQSYSPGATFFILISLGTIMLFLSFSINNVIELLKQLSSNKKEINDILFRQSLPKKFCYNVKLKTHTVIDIDIKRHVKNLRIRYIDDGPNYDSIEYKFNLGKKKYHEFVSISIAQKLFDCDVLNNF